MFYVSEGELSLKATAVTKKPFLSLRSSKHFYPITGTRFATGIVAIDKAKLVFSIGNPDAGT